MTALQTEQESDELANLIAATARGVFGTIGPFGSDSARAASECAAWHADGWNMLVSSGFIQAMRNESEGGVGISAALSIVRLSGAAALALPLAEAMGADWLLASAGLPPADKPTVFAAAPANFSKTAKGVHITGTIAFVPWARACDLVCVGLIDGQAVVAKMDRGDFTVIEGSNMADEPRDQVAVDITVETFASLPAHFDSATPHKLGAVLRAGQIAGAAEAAVDMTAEYSQDREQFGRPLSRFQAVQQSLAIMAGEAAAAGVAADLAADSLARGLPMPGVASAKIRAGEAAGKIAAAAHQIHGAIGFTREYALQLLTRRLWSWRNEFGTEAEWSIVLGRSLAAQQLGLWPAITGF